MARFGFGGGFNSQSSQFAPIFGSESRNFTTLDAAGSKHYTFPTVTLTGDYKKSYLIYFTGSSMTFSGSTLNGNNRVNVTTNGVIQWRPENGTTQVVTPIQAIPENVFSLVVVERIGSNGTITVNGVEEFNGAVPTGSCITSTIGSRSGSSFSTGIIADVQIFDAGDRIRFYKIDETWDGPSTVLVDSGADGSNGTAVNITPPDSETFTKAGDDWLGVELWTFGDAVSNGAEGTFANIIGGAPLTSGFIYQWAATVSGITAGQIRLFVGNTAVIAATSDGDSSGIQEAGSTDLIVRVGNSQCNSGASVINTTAKRILEGA